MIIRSLSLYHIEQRYGPSCNIKDLIKSPVFLLLLSDRGFDNYHCFLYSMSCFPLDFFHPANVYKYVCVYIYIL